MSITKTLQEGRRDLGMLADIALADGETLRCTEVLRLLPGKRVVMRAQWRGQLVLIKLILDTAPGRRNLRREQAGYRILKDAGIVTPELLLTAHCEDGSHILLFEFVAQAQRLSDLWRDETARRSQIAASGLDLVARLHRKGCLHTDLHLDNFLLADGQIYVIDAASVEVRPNTEYGRWQRENLALFLAQFAPLGRTTVWDALATQYAEAATDPELEQAVDRAWQRRKSRYLKKCFRESSEFSIQKNWCQVATWKRVRHSADLVSFLQNPDDWVAKGELLKGGNSATVVRVSMDGRPVAIKRNNIKNLCHWWQRCLRPTRSHVNWRNAHLLRISGIETPEPIAFVERRWGPFRFEGYYVCAYDSSPSVEKKYASKPPTQPELDRFSELFKRMNLARIYHGDLKSSNLLVTDKGIALIDLESMKTCSAFNVTTLQQKDRNRFLKNWQDKPTQWKLFSEVFRSTNLGGY